MRSKYNYAAVNHYYGFVCRIFSNSCAVLPSSGVRHSITEQAHHDLHIGIVGEDGTVWLFSIFSTIFKFM